jgi:hypothetical protein
MPALLALCACAGCAGNAPSGCTGVYRTCTPFEEHCRGGWLRCGTDASGATQEIVRIDSRPTTAAIYVDGRFVGYSPVRHRIRFSSETSSVQIAAVPIYEGQAQQTRELLVPPLPRRVLFLMNNAPRGTANTELDESERQPGPNND